MLVKVVEEVKIGESVLLLVVFEVVYVRLKDVFKR